MVGPYETGDGSVEDGLLAGEHRARAGKVCQVALQDLGPVAARFELLARAFPGFIQRLLGQSTKRTARRSKPSGGPSQSDCSLPIR
jgi:hypothetical protein